jgi:hypothetical protein
MTSGIKRFLLRFLKYGFLVWAVLILTDILCSWRFSMSNVRAVQRWYALFHEPSDAEVLAVGNSRAGSMIDPDVLDSVLAARTYNLATDNGNIGYQTGRYILWRRLNESAPRLIVMNVDVATNILTDKFETEQFYPFFWNSLFRSSFFPYESFSVAERFVPMYRYRGVRLLRYLRKNPRDDMRHSVIRGYTPMEGTNWREMNAGFNYFEDADHLLRSFLDMVSSEGAKVLFVIAPVWHECRERTGRYDDMVSYYRTLADEYGVVFLDFSDTDMCFEKELYYDEVHMNKDGARIYSDSLACAIRRLRLLEDESEQ